MSDLAACRAAYEAANPFTSPTHSLAASHVARQRLGVAQVAEWNCGRCCGERDAAGLCRSVSVQLARQGRLAERGMGLAARRVIGRVCEQSETWQLIQVAAAACKDAGVEGVTLARLADAVIEEVRGE
jgi:hypothetical protein